MIGKEASRAFTLLSALDVCREINHDSWRAVVARIVIDLDERGQGEALCIINSILQELWDKLPHPATPPPPTAQGLAFGAAVEAVPWYEDHDADGTVRRCDKVVEVYLGDQELTRITVRDMVIHKSSIIIDETVVRWLNRRLA